MSTPAQSPMAHKSKGKGPNARKALMSQASKPERKSKYKFPEDTFSKAKKATSAGTPSSSSLNRAGEPLVDFYIFPNLPAEIQDDVWEMVAFQRTAPINIIVESHNVKMVGKLPKFPAFLHATSGARAIGLRYFEVLESFDVFRREVPAHALGAPFPPAQVAPHVPAPGSALAHHAHAHGPAPAPAGFFAPVAPVAWLNNGAGAANHGGGGGGFGQYGPGHVLGGNNTNTVAAPNLAPFMAHAGPSAPPGGNTGNAGNPGNVGNGGGGILGNGSHRRAARELNEDGTPRQPKVDLTKVILFGAIPVVGGNVVGYGDTPAPDHPLLPVEPAREVLPGLAGKHKFYINLGAAMFKLQIGDPSQYHYPTFSLAEESSVKCVKNHCLSPTERDDRIRDLLTKYETPGAFPGPGKLPEIFKKIENIVLNLAIPPCINPNLPTEWVSKSAKVLLNSLFVRTTARRFPNLRSLDFYVPGDHKIDPVSCDYSFKHWRSITVRDSDGITLNGSLMAFFEMMLEVEMVTIRKELGKNDLPGSRLLVYVPEKGGRMEFDANFAH
ncbi:hypothetical protein IFR05_002223 [Cadophora sp. M221]|nr:hypothetical protein IFR05_002223 [Cadophora sp. M221]